LIYYKAHILRRAETGEATSIAIAKYLLFVLYQLNPDLLYIIFALQSLCRARGDSINFL